MVFSRMIDRTHPRRILQKKLDANRVVALIGPRQCGKTTLAREFVSPGSVNYSDLEDRISDWIVVIEEYRHPD